jgi:hypothetical protein
MAWRRSLRSASRAPSSPPHLVVVGASCAQDPVRFHGPGHRIRELFPGAGQHAHRLALLLGAALHVVAQALAALPELVDRALEAIERLAIRLGALAGLGRADPDVRHAEVLRVHRRATLVLHGLAGLDLRLGLGAGLARLFDLALRFLLFAGRERELGLELPELERDLLGALAGAGEVVLGALQVLVGLDDGDLGVVRLGARGVERRLPARDPIPKLSVGREGRAHVGVELAHHAVEITDLPLHRDHVGVGLLTTTTGQGAADGQHLTALGDERRRSRRDRRARRAVARSLHDDDVHRGGSAHQRLVLRLVAARDRRGVRGSRPLRISGRVERARRRRGEACGARRSLDRCSTLVEEANHVLPAASRSVIDHVLEALAERCGERLGERSRDTRCDRRRGRARRASARAPRRSCPQSAS